MNTRKIQEQKIYDYAEVAGIIGIYPHISTHLGKVTMLDSSAHLIEEISGDWCIQGTLDQLTDQEFDQVFTAVQKDAIQVMATAVSK